jgi:hypothetical protein
MRPTVIKNVFVTIICITTILILTFILYDGHRKNIDVLEGGDIQHAMDSKQY